jgi:peptidoglycan/LPS O-acetylase OafA/YrhL
MTLLTEKKHFIALDHVRAIAALLVISWHFMHGAQGSPVPFEGAPSLFFMAIFDEGHTGVALFMVLSGYLFATLLDKKRMQFIQFIRNRALRLFPLLTVVIFCVFLIKIFNSEDISGYWTGITKGLLLPTLPNGGWSITVELHFYIILPFLLMLQRKHKALLLTLVALTILLRLFLHKLYGETQSFSYWTLAGRIDQFAFGIIAFNFRKLVYRKHITMILSTLAFLGFYWIFDKHGGFYLLPTYPSPHKIWIVLPTIEAVYYSFMIAWYSESFAHKNDGLSRILGNFGKYSYSFYLLHFFFVFKAADFIHTNVYSLSNFYIAFITSIVFYLAMYPIGFLSYQYIESPFLLLRKNYTIATAKATSFQ